MSEEVATTRLEAPKRSVSEVSKSSSAVALKCSFVLFCSPHDCVLALALSTFYSTLNYFLRVSQ